MTSPEVKLKAESLFRSSWCDKDAFQVWVAERNVYGLLPSSWVTSNPRREPRIPVVRLSRAATLKVTSVPDTHQRVTNAYLDASSDESSEESSDERLDESLDESSDESSSELDSDEDEKTPKLTAQNVRVDQTSSPGPGIARADAPSSCRERSTTSTEIGSAEIDCPNTTLSTVVSYKDHIPSLVKAIAPNCGMELDDDTSAELLAILRETGQSFNLVLQRKAVEAKAKAREAELMEEIRILKEQVATGGSAQRTLKTRLEAIIQDLPMEPVKQSDVTAPEATEVIRKKRKSSLHEEDDTRPSQRARHTFLVPK
ncbi:hypothetical protein ONZ45_g4240 [Pleurotus djamor]|nr:hypothetical protein ONZ45_g4240 [Pleurotus djamor]